MHDDERDSETRCNVDATVAFVAFGCTLFVRRDEIWSEDLTRKRKHPLKISLLFIKIYKISNFEFVYYFYSVFNKILIPS